MTRIFLISLLSIGLIGCGAGSEPAAQTPESAAILSTELPELSGDYVWDMIEADSTVSFEAFYNRKFTGKFSQFQTVINFDPTAPETGEIHAIVDLSSVWTKDNDVKSNLPTSDWFDIASHPYATFKSTNISALAGDNFEAKGEMTLKGITQPVTLTFGLKVTDEVAHATGGFEISRQDFKVGTGPDFETEDWVHFPVKVMVDIKAKR